MKKTRPSHLLGASLIGFGLLHSQPGAEDAKFTKIVDTYLDEYWKFYPTAGSSPVSPSTTTSSRTSAKARSRNAATRSTDFNKELVTKVAADKLSSETQIDREILLRRHRLRALPARQHGASAIQPPLLQRCH